MQQPVWGGMPRTAAEQT